jgi:hypothetical protein
MSRISIYNIARYFQLILIVQFLSQLHRRHTQDPFAVVKSAHRHARLHAPRRNPDPLRAVAQYRYYGADATSLLAGSSHIPPEGHGLVIWRKIIYQLRRQHYQGRVPSGLIDSLAVGLVDLTGGPSGLVGIPA